LASKAVELLWLLPTDRSGGGGGGILPRLREVIPPYVGLVTPMMALGFPVDVLICFSSVIEVTEVAEI